MDTNWKRPAGRVWARVRACMALALVAGVAACGGGGSDSPSATVSVSPAEVDLGERYEDLQNPEPKSVTVSVSGHGVAAVGVAYDDAYPVEGWVGAQLSGTGSPYTLTLGLAAEAPVGEHTAHLVAGAVDDKGNILDLAPLTVRYKVLARLRADASSLAFEGVNGAPPPAGVALGLHAQGLGWTAVTSHPWIRLSAYEGTGDDSLTVTVDDQGLASGQHIGHITLTSADGQTVTVDVTFTLASTVLVVSTTRLDFGGANGRDGSARSLQLSLGTQGNAYDWELASVPAWLEASRVSGQISSTPQEVSFTPDMTVAAGVHDATLRFIAHVNGDTIEQEVTVQLRVDSQRLHVSEDGVAFASTPGWSRLTRTVQVKDNFGMATSWTASSDQAWLSVTSSGVAGGTLTLTADPGTLAGDTLSIATVTIQSADPQVAKAYVRVGLWKGTATPSATVSKAGVSYMRIANDPVRPYVYAHAGGSSIDVYHAYTATKVATITGVGNTLRSMAVGSDGRNLYVVDEGFRRIAVVNLDTRTKTRVIATSAPTDGGYTLLATRVTGVEVLLGGDGTAYRAADGATVSVSTGMRYHMTASRDGTHLYHINGGMSPASAGGYTADYTAAGSGTLLTQRIDGPSMDVGSDGNDIAVSPDGKTLYTASSTSNSGSPYVFKTFNALTLSPIGHLPPVTIWPTGVETGSDGRVAGGVRGTYESYDISLYSKTGALLRTYKVAGYAQSIEGQNLVFTGDALMLAATTSDPKLVFIPIGP